MKIKNKAELVRRARWHRTEDRFVQGHYADFEPTNGDVKFTGCAIGCLATPARKRELKGWMEKLRESIGHFVTTKDLGAWDDSDSQTKRLGQEFGITEALARLAEGVFESADTREEAADFVVEFAKALPEGKNITPRMVATFRRNAYDYESAAEVLDWLRNDCKVLPRAASRKRVLAGR